MKTVKDYPKVCDIKEAVDMALTLLPDQYTDAIKTRNLIRNRAILGTLPGAESIEFAGQKQRAWRYDRDKLFKWLSDEKLHKAGRPKKRAGK